MGNERNLTDGSRRLGWFSILGGILRSPGHQDLLLTVQKDMAVLSARDDVMQDRTTFLGVGPMFEPVEPHQVVPHYSAMVSERDDGEGYDVEFVKGGD